MAPMGKAQMAKSRCTIFLGLPRLSGPTSLGQSFLATQDQTFDGLGMSKAIRIQRAGRPSISKTSILELEE